MEMFDLLRRVDLSSCAASDAAVLSDSMLENLALKVEKGVSKFQWGNKNTSVIRFLSGTHIVTPPGDMVLLCGGVAPVEFLFAAYHVSPCDCFMLEER